MDRTADQFSEGSRVVLVGKYGSRCVGYAPRAGPYDRSLYDRKSALCEAAIHQADPAR